MKKLFVVVRTNLQKSSPAVQAGHAVAQFILENPDSDWKNSHLIYLKVRNLQDLKELHHWIQKSYPATTIVNFTEPDLNNELTAIAFYNVSDNIFANLRLL